MAIFLNGKLIESLTENERETFKKQGLSITKAGEDIRLTLAIQALPPQNQVSFHLEKDSDGHLQAKAELDVDHLFKAEVNDKGDIQTGVTFKF